LWSRDPLTYLTSEEAHGVVRGIGVMAVAAALLAGGCGGGPAIDWKAPEDFLLWEDAAVTEGGVRLQYWSLVDAPADAVYAALADVEHYADFIPGVNQAQLLERTDDTATVQIAQRVISQQTDATVAWTFHPGERRVEFRTLQSDLAHNDGHHEVEASPDGRRCLVRSTFLVHQAEHVPAVPIRVLASATREAFLAAAEGVKRRATERPS
jgi:carbon monoxide dehydrogenase subunit G